MLAMLAMLLFLSTLILKYKSQLVHKPYAHFYVGEPYSRILTPRVIVNVMVCYEQQNRR